MPHPFIYWNIIPRFNIYVSVCLEKEHHKPAYYQTGENRKKKKKLKAGF